ncbi:fluoride efflux transporter FluC [Bifidobacterium samirii]|nr:CrcB family protein [Bifidobacterium samirii]
MKRMQARFNPLADGVVYLVVFLGGFVGTAMRYGLNLVMPDALADTGVLAGFHPATFIANMLACFIFATLTAYLSQASWLRKRARQLANRGLGMGMCGGFSTLSAMAIENLTAMHTGEIAGFMLYTLLSFTFGLIAAWSGATLGLEAAARRAVRDAGPALAEGARHGDAGRHADAGAAASAAGASSSAAETSAVSAAAVAVGAPESAGGPLSVLPPSDGAVSGSASHVGAAATASATARVEQSEPLLATTLVPSFEPDPVTDEIPMVADPLRGEARER